MILDLMQCKILLVGIGINALLMFILLLILNQAGVQPSYGAIELVSFGIFIIALLGVIILNLKPDLFACGGTRVEIDEEDKSCESIEMQESD